MLKPEFIASLKEIEGLDVEALVESLGVRPETSIRINRRKLDDPAVLGYDGLQPVPWCGSGFYLPDGRCSRSILFFMPVSSMCRRPRR